MIQTSHQVLDLALLDLAARYSLPRKIVDLLRFIIDAAWRAALKVSNGNPDHPAFQNPSISIWQTAFTNALGVHRSTVYRRGKPACDKGLLEITPGRVVMKSADECRRESGNRYSLKGELLAIWRAMVAAYRACRDPRIRADAARAAAVLARENGLESMGFQWPNQVFAAIAAGVESVWTRRPGAGKPPIPTVAEILETSDAAPAPAPAEPEKNPLIAVLEKAAKAGDAFAARSLAAIRGKPPDKV